MNQIDIRWKQRFQNFEQAFLRLQEAISQEDLNELERNGLIQRFEFTIELAWKVMKDFLKMKLTANDNSYGLNWRDMQTIIDITIVDENIRYQIFKTQ